MTGPHEPTNAAEGPDQQRSDEGSATPRACRELYRAQAEWLCGKGEACDVVLSSRVRLARNLAGFPFMARASRIDRRQILDLCRARITGAMLAERLAWVDLHGTRPIERKLLVERHLISKPHARGKLAGGKGGPDEPRGVAISLPDERLSIMVNEEDHLRIQIIRAGLALSDAYEQIDTIDDRIEAGLDYAFSGRFGYLTCCPTNVGTGIRLSVMLHLPALNMTGEIEKVKRAANDMALAIRGFYGEGSQASGDFFQISNQTTLGKTERVLLHEMETDIVPKVIQYERLARQSLLKQRGAVLSDKVQRALGLLRHARLISADEAMGLLSQVRLGVVLGLIEGLDETMVNHLMLLVQPAHLQLTVGREMPQSERRAARADLIRDRLGNPQPS